MPEDAPRGDARAVRPQPAPRAAAARSGCSCSSTAACTAPTTRARAGRTIGDGLPSDFGFPLALDPADPDSAYVIPLEADMDRVTPDGRVRVYETRDAGATLDAARRRAARRARLPDRAAPGVRPRAARATALELYFGATSGDVFGSGDAGATWFTAARAPAAGVLGAEPPPESQAPRGLERRTGRLANWRANRGEWLAGFLPGMWRGLIAPPEWCCQRGHFPRHDPSDPAA